MSRPVEQLTNGVEEWLNLFSHSSPHDVAHFDEMFLTTGDEYNGTRQLRPEWQQFVECLPPQNLADFLDKKTKAVTKQVLHNGITYNVYNDNEDSPSRPWSLDSLPFIITPDDWSTISKGVIERAHLMNAMMQDIYGDQLLLKQGLLPPALVYGSSGYLRPMQNHQPNQSVWLHLMAFDLARAPDGKWWVISHRIQAPSGLGYVLENRLTIAQTFPDSFKALRIQRIASFYKLYIEGICRLSPKGSSARVALLTPGPYNETYFEHVYLSRYLGITLVESSDLVVRDAKLYLKTVLGLEQIDVLLRRVDDEWIDPLELRPDSHLGIAALLQAIRANQVIVANTPGGGWLESPALHGFLPAISQQLLGHDLSLPSVPSWWCGEPPAWSDSACRLNQLIIKPTGYNTHLGPMNAVHGSLLNEAEKASWRATISQQPNEYTLQELIPLSKLPVWKDQGSQSRSLLVRIYASTDGMGNYQVLPGGLTRISGDENGVVSMQRGGSSVDTWVMTHEDIDTSTRVSQQLNADQVIARNRFVSSSSAEQLFWLGRYSERAESQLRLAKNLLKQIHFEELHNQKTLRYAERLCINTSMLYPTVSDFDIKPENLEIALISGLGDYTGQKTGTCSIGFNIAQLSRVGGSLRDRLSTSHWLNITSCGRLLDKPSMGMDRDEAIERINQLSQLMVAISGEQSDHMTRDIGWRFLNLGRQLERLIFMCDSLLALMNLSVFRNETALELLVSQADSVITYRARYQHRFEWLPTIDLLMFDHSNPRALVRIVYKIQQTLDKLPSGIEDLKHQLEQASFIPQSLQLPALELPIQTSTQLELTQWMLTLKQVALDLSNELGSRYFRMAEAKDQIT